MGREPNWWRKGYSAAKKGSTMSLPEEHFINDIDKLRSDDFNPIKQSYEYALDWVETQQWKDETGNKILPFIKKYNKDNRKTEAFIDRAITWADGYAYYMIEQYLLYWLSIPRKIPEEVASGLSVQALGDLNNGSTDVI